MFVKSVSREAEQKVQSKAKQNSSKMFQSGQNKINKKKVVYQTPQPVERSFKKSDLKNIE